MGAISYSPAVEEQLDFQRIVRFVVESNGFGGTDDFVAMFAPAVMAGRSYFVQQLAAK